MALLVQICLVPKTCLLFQRKVAAGLAKFNDNSNRLKTEEELHFCPLHEIPPVAKNWELAIQ